MPNKERYSDRDAVIGNQRRFRIEHDDVQNLSRVVDFGTENVPTNTALTDWVVHEAALVMRYDYCGGYLTP